MSSSLKKIQLTSRSTSDTIEDALHEAYDAGYKTGYEDALEHVRQEVAGKSYQKAMRALLTKMEKAFKTYTEIVDP